MKHVTIYTDGACSGNPGPGGWAAILRYGKEALGFEKITAETAKENKASAALLKKLGFELRECDRIIASL